MFFRFPPNNPPSHRRTGRGSLLGHGSRVGRRRRCRLSFFPAAGSCFLFVLFFRGQIPHPLKEHGKAGVGGDQQADHSYQEDHHNSSCIGESRRQKHSQTTGQKATRGAGSTGEAQIDESVHGQGKFPGTEENVGGTAPQHRKQKGAEHPQTHLSPAFYDKKPCGKSKQKGRSTKPVPISPPMPFSSHKSKKPVTRSRLRKQSTATAAQTPA